VTVYVCINEIYRSVYGAGNKNRIFLKILPFSTVEHYLLAFFYVIIMRIIITAKHQQRSY